MLSLRCSLGDSLLVTGDGRADQIRWRFLSSLTPEFGGNFAPEMPLWPIMVHGGDEGQMGSDAA